MDNYLSLNTFGQGPDSGNIPLRTPPGADVSFVPFCASGLLRYSYLLTYLFKGARRMSKDLYILPLCVFDTDSKLPHETRPSDALTQRFWRDINFYVCMYVKNIPSGLILVPTRKLHSEISLTLP